jgi:predicted transcriptional regulator
VSVNKNQDIENVYKKIRLLSNRKKFGIILATQIDRKNITELSKELKLSYNKCSDYVAALEKEKLIIKEKDGKEVYVKSKILISKGYF